MFTTKSRILALQLRCAASSK